MHTPRIRPVVIGDVLELSLWGEVVGSQAANGAAEPISDSRNPGVLAVGAVDPAYGTTVAPYTGKGPTNDGRVKPDVVGASCVHTSLDPECYRGARTAAASVAGLAALAQEALAAPGSQLARYVRDHAFDIAAPGPDNDSGLGKVHLPAPPPRSYPSGQFVAAYAPTRVLDTRSGPPVPANRIHNLDLSSSVPYQATAAVMNVTVIPTTPGYAQVYPTGWSWIGASSNINPEYAGRPTPNLVVVPIGADQRVSLYTTGGGHLLADLFGWFVPASIANGGRYQSLAPFRVIDTRDCTGIEGVPCDPATGGRRAGNGEFYTSTVTGRTDPDNPTNAIPARGVGAVALNVTVTQPLGAGYVQVAPGNTTPDGLAFSNLNYVAGQTVPNLVIVPVAPDGTIRFYTYAATHLVADVAGYFTDENAPALDTGLFTPVRPARLYDSRIVGPPITGGSPGATISPAGQAGIPAGFVDGVLLNLTATEAAGPGWVQSYPTEQAVVGSSSNVNVDHSGQTIANAAITKLGTANRFTLHASVTTHLIADTAGWFTTSKFGAITGTVTGPAGVPAAGVEVICHQPDDGDSYGAVTRDDGTYVIEGVPPSTYTVEFREGTSYESEWWDNQRDPANADPVTVTDGQVRTGIDARLERLATISGRVTGPNGQPISADTLVQAQLYPASNTADATAHAWIGSDGTYRLTGVAPGTYKLKFALHPHSAYVAEWWADKADAARANVLTVSRQDLTGIDATLAKETVILASLPMGGTVTVTTRAGQTVKTVTSSGDARIVVPPGSYKVRFTPLPDPPAPGVTCLEEWWNDKPDLETADVVTLAQFDLVYMSVSFECAWPPG